MRPLPGAGGATPGPGLRGEPMAWALRLAWAAGILLLLALAKPLTPANVARHPELAALLAPAMASPLGFWATWGGVVVSARLLLSALGRDRGAAAFYALAAGALLVFAYPLSYLDWASLVVRTRVTEPALPGVEMLALALLPLGAAAAFNLHRQALAQEASYRARGVAPEQAALALGGQAWTLGALGLAAACTLALGALLQALVAGAAVLPTQGLVFVFPLAAAGAVLALLAVALRRPGGISSPPREA